MLAIVLYITIVGGNGGQNYLSTGQLWSFDNSGALPYSDMILPPPEMS